MTKMKKPAPRKPFKVLLSKTERDRYQTAATAAKRALGDWMRLVCDDAALNTAHFYQLPQFTKRCVK